MAPTGGACWHLHGQFVGGGLSTSTTGGVCACGGNLSTARLEKSAPTARRRLARLSSKMQAHSSTPTSSPAYQLTELVTRGFYPTPYAAAPSTNLLTPWYLDYGHLAFWFFVGATLVIVLWLAYIFVGLSRSIEERRPVRETRGFSRAQTGDTLTAVLPLTWSITMLGHASTHSINFDENTTATAMAFTVVAYQWGWNYYFPRELVSIFAASPRLGGRGRLLGASTTHLPGNLAFRAGLANQAAIGAGYTARHGRHSAAALLNLLLPSQLLDAGLHPSWAVQSALLSTQPTTAVTETELQAVGGSASRATLRELSLLSTYRLQTLTAAVACATLGGGAVTTPPAAVCHLATPEFCRAWPLHQGYPTSTPTTNQRAAAAATHVGNRLALVHSHLASGQSQDARARGNGARAALHRIASATANYHAPQPLAASNLATPAYLHSQRLPSSPWAQPAASVAVPASASGAPLFRGGLTPGLGVGKATGTAQLGRWFNAGAAGALLGAPQPSNLAASTLTNLAPSSAEQARLATMVGVAMGGAHPSTSPATEFSKPTYGRLVSVVTASQFLQPRLTVLQLGSRVVAVPTHAGIGGRGWCLRPLAPTSPRASLCVCLRGCVHGAKIAPAPFGSQTISGGTWLPAPSDALPVRSGGAVPLDVAQVNSKTPTTLSGAASLALLAGRSATWAASTGLAGLPWDRVSRASLERQPLVGTGATYGGFLHAHPAALLALQRMRFDKLATSAVQPLPTRPVLTYQAAPAAPASLDAESGSAPIISGLVFPAAHVDLDVLFLGTRWAAEVNTSRRSDHLAKFGVTWGPLAAAAKANPVGQGAWGPVTSGPAALLGWGVASQLRVGWRAQADLGLLLGASAAAAARLHIGGSEAAAGTPAQATWGDGVRRVATPSTPTPSTLDLPSPSPAHQWRPLTMPQRSAPFPATAGGYLALRTDVGSMRRLRVTKGIYLPADTPLHGIFGSKDVIHSWAIPGLGVKVDCIPGYSSHRRLVFRWRGVYWGQCMEVCGRYHHWMPLLVRIVHRDSFLAWCLTYVRLLGPATVSGVRGAGAALGTLWSQASTQA